MFELFDFWLNACALVGILPGIIINKLDCKVSAIIGGLCIVASMIMVTVMVSTDHEHIKENPVWVLGIICFLAGQGSCLVLLLSMQALMNAQTIQASHVITTCCFAYYLGADSFIESIKDGLYPTETFTNFVFILAINALVLTFLNGFIITDEDDASGFFGKAASLTKGIIYKKTNYMHLFILLVYTTILVMSFYAGGLNDSNVSIILLCCVLLNWGVPIFLLCLLDPTKIKTLVGEPTDIEKKLSNKGVDKTFSEAALRIDFWYTCIVAMFLIGTARIFDESAEVLGMGDDDREDLIGQTYSVYEVIGAVSIGSALTFFRSKVRPSLMIIFCIIIGATGQISMIWPATFSKWIDPIFPTVAAASFAEGGLMVSIASFCHEEYGTDQIGILIGTMMSFGAAGLYALNEVFFPNVFEWYSEENGAGQKVLKKYGQWNVTMFSVILTLYIISLVLAIISHRSVVRREKVES